jgi:hypothetical protein
MSNHGLPTVEYGDAQLAYLFDETTGLNTGIKLNADDVKNKV